MLGYGIVIFADDVQLWRAISSEADRQALQVRLGRISSWSVRLILNCNVGKCVVIRILKRGTLEEEEEEEEKEEEEEEEEEEEGNLFPYHIYMQSLFNVDEGML
nr:unnamed protein product [Spirometra erinaceieuropaei]